MDMMRRFKEVAAAVILVLVGCDASNPHAELLRTSAQACRQEPVVPAVALRSACTFLDSKCQSEIDSVIHSMREDAVQPEVYTILALYRENEACSSDCRYQIRPISVNRNLQLVCKELVPEFLEKERHRPPDPLLVGLVGLVGLWLLGRLSKVGLWGLGFVLRFCLASREYGTYRGIFWLLFVVATGVWIGLGAATILFVIGVFLLNRWNR